MVRRFYESKDETRCATMDEAEDIMFYCDTHDLDGFVDHRFNNSGLLLIVEFTGFEDSPVTNAARFIFYLNREYPDVKVWVSRKANDPDAFVCIPLEGYDFD